MPGAGQDLAMLTRYAEWANQRLYRTLAGLAAAELTTPRPLFTGNILRMLNHVFLMDVVWKSHLLGLPHGLATRNPETAPPFAALRTAQCELDAWYVDYAGTLDQKQRDEIVHFTFIGGGEGAMSRGDILLHVVNHTTYHRGHIGGVLCQIGIETPVTDLPVFLRDARDSPRGQPANSSRCASKLSRSTKPASPTPTSR